MLGRKGAIKHGMKRRTRGPRSDQDATRAPSCAPLGPRPALPATYHDLYGDAGRALIEWAQRGDSVMTGAILTANEALIAKACGRWLRLYPELRDDILQEGRAGFLHALGKFETGRGLALSTYAVSWVRHYVQRYIKNHVRTVRVPVCAQERVAHLLRGGAHTFDEILESGGQSAVDAWSLLGGTVSLESRLHARGDEGGGGDERLPLGGLIADQDAVNPEMDAVRGEARARVHLALTALPERERDIVRLRFLGTGTESDLTLEKIGQKYGLSRERIRQVLDVALARLATLLTRLDRGEKLPPPPAPDRRRRYHRRR